MLVEDENMMREKVQAKMLNSNRKIEKAHDEETTHHTRDIDPMLNQCWATVYDACPTLDKHWVVLSCLLGI